MNEEWWFNWVVLGDLVCLETELCISTEEISSVVFIVTDSFS